ncbi:6'''-hydroxyparomomycin C oxidase [compost metagenome]
MFEPVPNRQSRVTLSANVDALGLKQAVVDWRLTDQDRDNFQRQTQLVLDGLSQMGVVQPSAGGRVPEAIWPDDVMGCWHHMGTTRMSEDPARGVVNADCRVHGLHNLYIAGSSVFPTVGSDSPTITIVALALRLADRISMELSRPEIVTAGQARSAA